MIQYSNIGDAWGHIDDKEMYKNNDNDILNESDNQVPISTKKTINNPISEKNDKIIENMPILNEIETIISTSDNNMVDNSTNNCILMDHVKICDKCRGNLMELLNNSQCKYNINGIKFNINRNILKIIFVLLILLIIIILISMCFKLSNNKILNMQNKYMNNASYMMSNGINNTDIFKLVRIP
jgi:hypothetical protein